MNTRRDNTRVIKAATGTTLSAKSWLTEAPLAHADEQSRSRRCRAARGTRRLWRHRPRGAQLGGLRPDRRSLRSLEDDETLLVQSGKPVGIFRTHKDAPRVLIANSNLVPHWGTWDHFNELDRKGLMMYGQMTAGSWIYIGTQGIVQGTYETFAEVGPQALWRQSQGQMVPDRRPRRHGRRPAAGRHHGRRLDDRHRMPALAHRYAARAPAISTPRPRPSTKRWKSSSARTRRASRSRSAFSAMPPKSFPKSSSAASGPMRVTDQTSAHDPVNGYLPAGWTLAEWEDKRVSDPQGRRRPPPWPR